MSGALTVASVALLERRERPGPEAAAHRERELRTERAEDTDGAKADCEANGAAFDGGHRRAADGAVQLI